MKRLVIATALLASAAPTWVAAKMSMEEHSMQAILQMQEAKEMKGLGTIVTVGDQVSCNYKLGTTRIQDAIDSGADEIRIASSTYNENLVIDDRSVVLKGGYATCADALNNVTNNVRQVISGVNGSAAATIQITGDTQRNTVSLERLSVQNGEAGFIAGGGVSSIGADLALTITDSNLTQNVGSLGGGLSVFNGDTDVTLTSVYVGLNSALEGGGIYCSGTENSVFINASEGFAGVYSNQATDGDGGGAYIGSGCALTSFDGIAIGGFLDVRGFRQNSATKHGGGIAVKSGGSAFINGGLFCFFGCIGDNTRQSNIDLNSADSDNDQEGYGGGIYATGLNTEVSLFNTNITKNDAQSGGGIAVENQATLTMRSLYALGTCWSPGSCSQLTENTTATSGTFVRGGGLYATSGAVVDISNTLISGNRADFGTAVYVFEAGTSLDLEGSLIVNNGDNGADSWGDNSTFRITSGATVKLDFNTIADNDLGGSSANIDNSGTLNMYSTIIHNADGQNVYSGAGTLNRDCLMVNETGTLPPSSFIILDNPEFINRAGGDFHLNSAISPAIDFCDDVITSPDYNDSDNEVRGYDDPMATNFLGSYDVGYDETYANDIIFIDGFE